MVCRPVDIVYNRVDMEFLLFRMRERFTPYQIDIFITGLTVYFTLPERIRVAGYMTHNVILEFQSYPDLLETLEWVLR